ncbi:MAG: endonuclease/exonuclease/phosphatase family protein [Bacteroidetes bacterium]|nr:endonuclease/exonuclease/phosphatase family protein [Bacteroidota bacterium]
MAAKRKTFFDGLMYVLNTLAAFALMASYLSNYVSPKYFTWFSFLGLAYPILFIANIIFAIWWALRMKLKIVLPIVAIALGYQQIPLLYKSHGNNQVVAASSALKVMTYNVHSLNRFKWIEDEEIPQKISQLIAEHNPDILLLQEYRINMEGWEVDFPYQYALLGGEYPANGNIIYSKLPIINQGFYDLPGPEELINTGRALWVDVEWQGRIMRVFNLHLSSVGLARDDYKSLSELDSQDQVELKRNIYKIGGSLSNAFKKRAYQVEFLDSIFSKLEQPLLVGGDFNDPPFSYTYHTLSDRLEDSYLAAGEGWVKTFDRKPLQLRIDYLLYSDDHFRCNEYQVVEEQLSDHYPLISEFSFR